jgi:hypothetical protein
VMLSAGVERPAVRSNDVPAAINRQRKYKLFCLRSGYSTSARTGAEK